MADSNTPAPPAAAPAAARLPVATDKPKAKVAKPDDAQASGTQMPTVGDTVHYVLHMAPRAGTHRPMTVTSITTPNRAGVSGHVLLEPGDVLAERVHFATDVFYDPTGRPGTWHYAEEAGD